MLKRSTLLAHDKFTRRPTAGYVGIRIALQRFATDNTAQIRSDEAREKAILDRIPAGRWGTPADLQGPFVFLAAPASNYLNGAIIPVAGGWLVR